MAQKKNYEYEVDINGDISGLKQAMNSAVREFNSLERSLKNIQKARELAPEDSSLLVKEQQLYASAIKESTNALRDLKRQKKELESNPNFKKGLTDESEQYTALVTKIKWVTAEQKKLKQEMASLPNANQDKINRKFESFKDTVGDAVKEIQKYKDALSSIDKQIELDPTNVDLYAQRQKVLNDMLKAYETTLGEANTAKDKFEKSANGKFYKNHAQDIEDVNYKVKKLTEEYEALGYTINNISSPKWQALSAEMDALSTKMGVIASKTAPLSNAFKGIMASAFDTAKSYESSIAQIKKVSDDLTDDVINDLKSIAVETGNSFENVAEYATISAALGLAGDEISTYTKALIDLNAVSGGAFSGEEGAKAVAVFLKQLNLGIDSAENFGSAIAVIGDKYADIGDETLNVATHLSSIATLVKTDQYQLLGLAGVMADLGLSADTNANAINRSFLQIENAIATDEDKLKTLATTSGMTAKEFEKAWGDNAVDAFLKFVDGLKSSVFNEINEAIDTSSDKIQEYADVLGWSADVFKDKWSDNSKLVFDQYVEKLGELEESSESASTVLKDLGISGVNTAQTLLRLAGSGNEVRSAIELATEAWEENSALQEKTNTLYGTTENKLNSFYESLRQLKSSFIENVLPTIKNIIDSLTDLTKALGKASPTVKTLATVFMGITASISPASRAIGNFAGILSLLGKSSKVINLEMVDAMGNVTTQVVKATTQANKFAFVLGTLPKVLGATALITAVVGIGYAIKKSYDQSMESYNKAKKAMDNYKDSITNAREELKEMTQEIANNTIEWEINQLPLEKQVKLTDELYQKLKEGNLTEEESEETKKQLKEQIDKLNQSLGEQKWNFDETKGAIVDEKGEIVDGLIPAYQELAVERKKSYLLERLQEQYIKGLELEEEAIRKRTEAQNELLELVEGYADKDWLNQDLLDFAQKLAENQGNFGEGDYEYFSALSAEAQTFAMQMMQASISLEKADGEAQKLAEEVANIDTFYDLLSNATGDSLTNLMDIYTVLGDEVWDKTLDGIQEEIDKVNAKLETAKAFHIGDIEELQKTKDKWEELYDLLSEKQEEVQQRTEENAEQRDKLVSENTKHVQRKVGELFNKENGTVVNEIKQGTDEFNTYLRHENRDTWLQYVIEAKIADDEVVAHIQNNDAQKVVNVVYNDPGFSVANGRPLTGRIDMLRSGGFGDFSGVFNSLRNSLSNIRSGGFGITVNANFNITNGSNINEATVSGWGLSIGEAINEYLGSQI